MRRVCGFLLALTAPAAYGQGPTHKNGFNGKTPFFQKGDSNVTFVEVDHAIGTRFAYNAPSAEVIKVDAQPGKAADAGGGEYVHYVYPTPKAPVSSRLAASVYVKAFRPGIQLRARVVLPKHRDPRNPNLPYSTLIVGDTYEAPGKWVALSLGDPDNALKRTRALVTAALKQPADFTDAYVDQLLLNVYPGPGGTEVWVDDLEIGPCEATPSIKIEAVVSRPASKGVTAPGDPVQFIDGQIRVGAKPFFPRMIRLTDTDPFVLANCQFNTVWLPADARDEVIDEVIRHGLKVVPSVPLPTAEKGTTVSVAKDADAIAAQFKRFASRDAVLMWDLGGGRTFDDVARVRRAADLVKQFDPKRPRGADLWDGYGAYANYLDVVGTHRWPLFTSLSMTGYRDWLRQRKALTGSDKMMISWVQTHLPDWYVSAVGLSPDATSFDAPIGPHPEQLRMLTYLSIAAGCRGVGFWSDRYLADSHHGRDRLLQLCLLNAELKMIEPILAADHGAATWVDTNHPDVKAAVIPTEKHVLVIPIWLGPNSQYCPDLSAVGKLKIRVPNVSEVAEPWLLNPCDVVNLKTRGDARPVPGGTEVTIPEFDTTALIVFTTDTANLLVDWQDSTRHTSGERCARWATTLAGVEFNKTLKLQESLQAVAPPVDGVTALFEESQRALRAAEKYLDGGQPNLAYREAMRALRPLRTLMHEHWKNATATLDSPSSSPYAVSVYSLPKHWELAARLQSSRPAGTVLPHGSFDLSAAAPAQGAAVASLPGWVKTADALDPVTPVAAIVNADGLADKEPPKTGAPTLGRHVLRLSMTPTREKDAAGKPVPSPGALERAYVAVDSPPVGVAPGTLVRVSFWAKVPTPITAGVDGAIVYDDAGGEGLALRLTHQPTWKKYHLYRIVPATGTIAVRFALTGLGTAYFDDVKIEPMVTGKPAGR
jgi:hypothetical protein